jgi:hypothetical protein
VDPLVARVQKFSERAKGEASAAEAAMNEREAEAQTVADAAYDLETC